MGTPIFIIILAFLLILLWGSHLFYRRRVARLEQLVSHTSSKLESLQVHFERFAPPDVVERLTQHNGSIAPERREVTVLFADLIGFTAMCDQLDPIETVGILNGYFSSMNEVLKRHHGKVTELVGDGMLALFGALGSNPWQVRDAVNGALAMRVALLEYNQKLRGKNLPELAFGIGIHKGEVLAGLMGNEELAKFGVVGDPINVASRVEQLTRLHGVDLLITEEIRKGLGEEFRLRELPPTQVKGKREPIPTYFVEGRNSA